MAKSMKSVLNVASEGVALEGVLEGARRATGSAPSSAAPADPEVVATTPLKRTRQDHNKKTMATYRSTALPSGTCVWQQQMERLEWLGDHDDDREKEIRSSQE